MCSLAAPVLEPQPGALPMLEHFGWDAAVPPVQLPASWAAPGVFPALRVLDIRAPLGGSLPAAWADGFGSLTHLALADGLASPSGLAPHEGVQRAPDGKVRPYRTKHSWCEFQPPRRLPPEWGRGFPALRDLKLSGLCLGGPIPPPWLGCGGFRDVTHL